MIVLGIESSCDESGAAIVCDGIKILSSVVYSQISTHAPYGGVVPELAARKHMEAIVPVVSEAIQKAGISPKQIDAVSVTQGPGLIGSLLVGFSFAKAYAFALGIPWIGVNHLYGHISALNLEDNSPDFPFVVLLVSGGHTSIYYVKSNTDIEILGHTLDDAAGEAFDKGAKILGLGYPGGIIIDNISKQGDKNKILFPRVYLDKSLFDFSFSGIKTSINRYVQNNQTIYKEQLFDIAASFQEAIVDVLSFKLINAAIKKQCERIAIVGGVAANSRLRDRVKDDAKKHGFSVYIPSPSLCGDNAAMIAANGYHYLKEGGRSNLTDDVFSKVLVG
ncbi:MAG: tRNA (adenosine(37)-N6)-threonylcarbamoyltransferase complex transferase subunit TsaD [Desulfobacterales bacterium]|nr:tRNA (adenosine(37)-N6)-threonylcarbamoyltransferase complex transferase subunit TsaD [Desulfobacterales bacterium]MBF0396068.1 tRNA (adenosine(37)-N6)-threonylcarbamoyltransferase complex transferase subunit TsaD [Desulfobacterales bacterium]